MDMDLWHHHRHNVLFLPSLFSLRTAKRLQSQAGHTVPSLPKREVRCEWYGGCRYSHSVVVAVAFSSVAEYESGIGNVLRCS